MMNLFLNGLAASAGGGLTYLRNVLPHLSARTDVRSTVAVNPDLRRELGRISNISLVEINPCTWTAGRFWQEQTVLPALIKKSGADVLVSTGNFALCRSPVPQILLSRNSLYTSDDFFHDLCHRREYGLWLDTRIKGAVARRSVHWADCTVAPTEAFAQELHRWTGHKVAAIHHGFDRKAFFGDQTRLDVPVQQQLESEKDALRLLYVSHYNYYRNFETLFRALPLLRGRLGRRKLKLFLTCRLRADDSAGGYRTEAASSLLTQLGVTDSVMELGPIPYSSLHHVYRACDIYVTPAYAESFAHPLVEAMASRLPVIASDSSVHREICQDAALYFHRFSAEELADRVGQIAACGELSRRLSLRGLERSRSFSWDRHVDELVVLAEKLLADPSDQREAVSDMQYKAS
jgi:glycosyltransferase involved in cell wall biosynthesis